MVKELSDRERMTFAAPLIMEVDAVVAHLTHGDKMILNYKFGALDADPLFSCLAIGMEKLTKLTIGLACLDENGSWGGFGNSHDVAELDAKARAILARRLGRSNSPSYLKSLLSQVQSDALVDGMIATVSSYGMQGRYVYLDRLAGRAAERPAPRDLWEDVSTILTDRTPGLLGRLASAGYDEARREMNVSISDSLRTWWTLYARCWQHGVAGTMARQWSGTLMPKPHDLPR